MLGGSRDERGRHNEPKRKKKTKKKRNDTRNHSRQPQQSRQSDGRSWRIQFNWAENKVAQNSLQASGNKLKLDSENCLRGKYKFGLRKLVAAQGGGGAGGVATARRLLRFVRGSLNNSVELNPPSTWRKGGWHAPKPFWRFLDQTASKAAPSAGSQSRTRGWADYVIEPTPDWFSMGR